MNKGEAQAELLSAVRSLRAWVEHWQIDIAHGLKPTPGSLEDALGEADAAIAIAKATGGESSHA